MLERKLVRVLCVTHSTVLRDLTGAQGCGCERGTGLFVLLLVIHLFIPSLPAVHLRGTELCVEDGEDKIPALQGLTIGRRGRNKMQ